MRVALNTLIIRLTLTETTCRSLDNFTTIFVTGYDGTLTEPTRVARLTSTLAVRISSPGGCEGVGSNTWRGGAAAGKLTSIAFYIIPKNTTVVPPVRCNTQNIFPCWVDGVVVVVRLVGPPKVGIAIDGTACDISLPKLLSTVVSV